MRYALTVLTVSALLLPGFVAAQADRWKIVDMNSDVVAFVDAKSLRRTGNRVRAWIRWDWTTAQTSDAYPKREYNSEKSLVVYDCVNRTSAPLQRVRYAELFAEGAVVESLSVDEADAKSRDVVPETLGERLLDFVCDTTAPKKK